MAALDASLNKTAELPPLDEPFLSTPVWRWGLPLHADTWLRFDTFSATALEMRRNASSDAMPTFPVGRVVSIDTAAMNMIIEVEAEEVHLVLKRESLRERPRPKSSAGSSATKSSA